MSCFSFLLSCTSRKQIHFQKESDGSCYTCQLRGIVFLVLIFVFLIPISLSSSKTELSSSDPFSCVWQQMETGERDLEVRLSEAENLNSRKELRQNNVWARAVGKSPFQSEFYYSQVVRPRRASVSHLKKTVTILASQRCLGTCAMADKSEGIFKRNCPVLSNSRFPSRQRGSSIAD